VIERAVEQTGYADFFQLRALRVLPNETANYVPIILAMTIMAKNADAYGLQVVPDEPVEYDTIRTAAATSLALIGDLTDTSLPELLKLNPALLKNTAPAEFEVRVPKGTGNDVLAALESIPAERRASWRVHRVEPGENVTSIARLFSATPSQILTVNNLTDAEVAAGTRLVIPAVYHEPVAAARKPAAHTAAKPATHTVARTAAPVHKTPSAAAKTPVHRPSVTVAQAQSRSAGVSLN
jgi:membrane-bound lytic murein transglycosylase D